MDFFENVDRQCKKTMLVRKISKKGTKELTLFNNCKFVSFSKIFVQLKMKHRVWQPSFDQPL